MRRGSVGFDGLDHAAGLGPRDRGGDCRFVGAQSHAAAGLALGSSSRRVYRAARARAPRLERPWEPGLPCASAWSDAAFARCPAAEPRSEARFPGRRLAIRESRFGRSNRRPSRPCVARAAAWSGSSSFRAWRRRDSRLQMGSRPSDGRTRAALSEGRGEELGYRRGCLGLSLASLSWACAFSGPRNVADWGPSPGLILRGPPVRSLLARALWPAGRRSLAGTESVFSRFLDYSIQMTVSTILGVERSRGGAAFWKRGAWGEKTFAAKGLPPRPISEAFSSLYPRGTKQAVEKLDAVQQPARACECR